MTINRVEPFTYFFQTDGHTVPNNPNLPVLIYNQVLIPETDSLADLFIKRPLPRMDGAVAGAGVSMTFNISTAMRMKRWALPKDRQRFSSAVRKAIRFK